MAVNETAVIPAQPVVDPRGDVTFQAMTKGRALLADRGIIKLSLNYVDNGVHLDPTKLVSHDTLDKILNILEDEAIG